MKKLEKHMRKIACLVSHKSELMICISYTLYVKSPLNMYLIIYFNYNFHFNYKQRQQKRQEHLKRYSLFVCTKFYTNSLNSDKFLNLSLCLSFPLKIENNKMYLLWFFVNITEINHVNSWTWHNTVFDVRCRMYQPFIFIV